MMSRGLKGVQMALQRRTELEQASEKTNMMVFALMTPIKIKNMFQIMRLKEIAVMKSKMTLQIGFMQD